MRPILAALAALFLLAPPAEAAKGGVARGSVWLDADADGRREAGEGGLARVAVTLQRKRAGAWHPVATLRTSAAGAWSRRRLAPGRYRLALALPARGSAFSPRGPDSDVRANGRSPKVRLRAGRTIRLDAGVVPRPQAGPPAPAEPVPVPPAPPPAVLDGVAWDDVDRDGVRDAGEPARAGVALELWDAARTAPMAATTSDLDGRFSFTAPAAGEYRLRHVLVPGTFYAPNGAGSVIHDDGGNAGFTDALALAPGATTAAVGVLTGPPITIGDLFWRDSNADGSQDDGLGGTAGEVELWNDSLTQRLAVAVTTGADGHYSLAAVAGGAYRVRFVLTDPDFYGFSPRDAATDTTDSDVPRLGPLAGITDTLRPMTSTTSVDAGRVIRQQIGDLVWSDVDDDGLQDDVEKGVSGVTVELWDASATTRFGTTTTSSSGHYVLTTPYPGTYRVRVVLPGRATGFSVQDAGSDDLEDSDVDDAGWTDPIAADPTLLYTFTRDAGVRFP